MKRVGIRLLTVFTFLLIITLPSIVGAQPAIDPPPPGSPTKPYFKAYGGDVFAGGWFNNNAISCSPTDDNYQNAGSDQKVGGILAYAYNSPSAKGASSEQGALALGTIDGDNSGKGFYSANGSPGYKTLSFANDSSWGGLFAGAASQPHCIADYYTTKQSNPQPIGTTINIAVLDTGQYSATGSSVTVSSVGSVAASKNITVFISGNAYISSNITYTARSNFSAATAPKLAIVVLGNIYVSNSVTQLDGLYIVQPDSSQFPSDTDNANTGKFVTCHNLSGATTATWISANCRNKLTVNGAVIAKKAILLRAIGNVSTATNGEAASSANIAEVFNYIPEMVLGSSFFGDSANASGTVESLQSLPPVF